MSNWTYVGIAFGVTYFVLAAYTVYLWRVRKRAWEAVEAEKRRLGELE